MKSASSWAPVNIALIKYWGKRDEKLNLPTNDSLSFTLDSLEEGMMNLRTFATVTIIDGDEDILIVNGENRPLNDRIIKVLTQIRRWRTLQSVCIETKNDFPISAGLASSSSAYAAITTAIQKLLTPPLDYKELCFITRLGSGSALRSLGNGLVRWTAGVEIDGMDSICQSYFNDLHWPELKCLVVVLSESVKLLSSKEGMQRSIMTSALYPARLDMLPYRMDELIKAISAKDFPLYAHMIMQESNQFHAICQDSYPPIRYLNEDSVHLIELVHECINREGVKAAYTFDAGPNPFIFCLQNDLDHVKQHVIDAFGSDIRMALCRIGKGAASDIYNS